MNYRGILQPRVLRYLDEQTERIAANHPHSAARWLQNAVDALQSLQTFPQRCAVAPI